MMKAKLSMSDMNSLIIILLAEACFILLVVLVVVLWLQIKSKGRQRKAVEQLVSQIKQQSKTRTQETGSFLQESYDLTDNELTSAVKSIDKQERKFFQKLVDVLGRSDVSQITSLDASVAELVDTYKSLKPKAVSANIDEGAGENTADIEALKVQNESLVEELKITKETMSNMIKEFGSMFGGGQDHDLDNAEVAEKVTTPGESPDESDIAATKEENLGDSHSP